MKSRFRDTLVLDGLFLCKITQIYVLNRIAFVKIRDQNYNFHSRLLEEPNLRTLQRGVGKG